MSKEKNPTGKSFVGTCNNYTQVQIDAVKAVPCQRIVCGKEVGEQKGTPHLQLAIVFKNAKRMKAVQKLLGGHWALKPMHGKWEDQEYCCKDGEMIRMEDNTQQGARTDITEYSLAIQGKGRKRPATDRELIDEYPVLVCKFPRFHNFVRKVIQREGAYAGYQPLSVEVYVGAAGCGKNTKTMKWNFDEQYVLALTEPKQWFPDYQGQNSILMHEYSGQWPLARFLNLTDGNTVRCVENKGGETYLTNKKWTFTTNVHPYEWYEFSDKQKEQTIDQAFKRRITKIYVWDTKVNGFIME